MGMDPGVGVDLPNCEALGFPQRTPRFRMMSLRKWYEDQPDYGASTTTPHSPYSRAGKGPTYEEIKEKLQYRVKHHKKRAKEWKDQQDNLEKERNSQGRQLRQNVAPMVSETPRGKKTPMVLKPISNVLCPPSHDDYNDSGERVQGTKWTLVRYYRTR